MKKFEETFIYNDEQKKENRSSFLKRLESKLTEEQIKDIDFAYDIAKESHRTQKRDSGERYFEHPRAGCLIMLDELDVYDRNLIISFLLHDIGEDTAMFGNITSSYKEFLEKASFRLQKLFGEKVADTVIRLTKPSIDNDMFMSKEEVYDFYIKELQKSEDAIFLKMIDRLHNLRSLISNRPEKIQKQIKETEDLYLPIFSKIDGDLKTKSKILTSKIQDALDKLKNLK